MIDTKKLKKLMIDKDVSNIEMQLLLIKSSQSWYNKLNYVNTFSAVEQYKIIKRLDCNYEDILFESSEEYTDAVYESRK